MDAPMVHPFFCSIGHREDGWIFLMKSVTDWISGAWKNE